MTARPDISLTPDELRSLLARVPEGVLVAITADGTPIGAPARFAEHPAPLEPPSGFRGVLGLRATLHPDEPLVGVLAVGDRVCCSVERSAVYREIEGAGLHGTVAAVDGPVVTVDIVRTVSFAFAKSQPLRG